MTFLLTPLHFFFLLHHQVSWLRRASLASQKTLWWFHQISFNDYKDVLFSWKGVSRKMNVIRSRQHNVSTEQVNKIAFSVNDDKRIIQPNTIQTLAHGFRGWGQKERHKGKQKGPGKDKGGLMSSGGLAGGQGASTETGEHRGSKQRPHKTRDFEKCKSMPKTYLLTSNRRNG